MKITVNDNSYIELKVDLNKKLNMIFKTKKDEKTNLFLTAKLDSVMLDNLISNLISLKTKVE